MADSYRGLKEFIKDIRNCNNKEAERARVEKELANVRTKFKSEKLSAYERKKYVLKLLYIYMLGYDVEFGHMEAVGLISSVKYGEKQVGYLVTSVLLNEHHDFLRLVINSIRNDIVSKNENFQALALILVANIGGKEFAEALGSDVQRVLVSPTSRPVVRKKAALCLLRLYRKNPDILNLDDWTEHLPALLDERDLGLLTSVCSLCLAMVTVDSAPFQPCLLKVVRLLERLVRSQDIPPDYVYYGVASPWLQVKCLRIMSAFPVNYDPNISRAVNALIGKILSDCAETAKNVNKNNSLHAVLFEALGLVMQLDNPDLVQQAVQQLGRFIAAREPNTRYLGLANMGRLSVLPDVMEAIRMQQRTISDSLNDPDISIRRRALDLLYSVCDRSSAESIVNELLTYLVTADFAIREELTLKVAILAEKFAVTLPWYVEVILTLLDKAGDYVSDDIWHRLVQVVTNHDELHRFAADRCAAKLREGAVHEVMIKVGAYFLGEYGHLISTPVQEYFALLHNRFGTCSLPTRALMLSAYAKMLTHTADASFQAQVQAVFVKYHAFAEAELQQRSVEYYWMGALPQATLKEVLAEMPPFPERESVLERRADGAQDGEPAVASPPPPAPPQQQQQQQQAEPAYAQQQAYAEPAYYAQPAAAAAAPPQPQPAAAPLVREQSLPPVVDLALDSPSFTMPSAPAPAAAAPPPPAAPSAAVDLLAQLVEAPPPVQQGHDPFAMSGDLLGGAPGGAGQPQQQQGMAAAVPLHDARQLFARLCGAASGIVYEDTYLQVGCRCDWRPPFGSLTLFFGNKHTAPLEGFRVNVATVPGVRLVNVGSAPQQLAPQQQLQYAVEVAAQQPTTMQSVPTLQVVYRPGPQGAAPQASFTAQLPIVACKFLVPAPPMDKTHFYETWRALAGPPLKLEAHLSVSPAIEAGGLGAMEALLQALQLHVIPGVDPNPANIFAASSFVAESGATVLCIVRVESDANNRAAFKVTVASPSNVVTASVKDTISLVAQQQ